MTNEELNKWLADEIGVYPGCCSSIECVKYDIAKETAIKMQEWMIEKAAEWLVDWFTGEDFGVPITNSGIKDFIEDFKKDMEE